MKRLVLIFILFPLHTLAHIPSLLLPINGTPITSYFIGQSEISRAIYSELTKPDDFLVVNLIVKEAEPLLIQLLTPQCENIPQYELYQPSALLLKGELPWKVQGETNEQYLTRLKSRSLVEVTSNFQSGERPTFHEEFSDTRYWVGGQWSGNVNPGLYSVVVFDQYKRIGNFNVSFNEKEAWTPDLFEYADQIIPTIKAGFCSPSGFTGELCLQQ